MRLRPGFPRIGRLAPVLVALATVAACELPRFGAPDPASEEGDRVLSLWQGFFVAAIAVGVLVWGLIIFAVVRYRRRDDSVPDQRPYHIPLEVFYTATPVAIVAVLFAASWFTEARVTDLAPDPDVRVDVIGFQWSWQFVYPDENLTVSGEPGEPPEMVLPLERLARLELVSNDVVHSFWVPDFLSKRDLIPGIDNEIDVRPTRAGEYIGRCAEFCGLDHWSMYFSVRVVPEGEYEAWLDEQRAAQRAAGDEGEDREAERLAEDDRSQSS